MFWMLFLKHSALMIYRMNQGGGQKGRVNSQGKGARKLSFIILSCNMFSRGLGKKLIPWLLQKKFRGGQKGRVNSQEKTRQKTFSDLVSIVAQEFLGISRNFLGIPKNSLEIYRNWKDVVAWSHTGKINPGGGLKSTREKNTKPHGPWRKRQSSGGAEDHHAVWITPWTD